MEKIGISRERAINASSYFSTENSLEKAESVLKFLKERGFGDTQTRKLLSKRPRLLLSKINSTFKPKFDFLEELGVSRTDTVGLVLKDHDILWRSLDGHLKPSVLFLRAQFGSDFDLPKVLKRALKLLSINLRKTVLPQIELLRSHGVSDKQIQTLFITCPGLFTCKVQLLENIISRIEKLNAKFRPGMLIYAVFAVRGVSVATFEAKCKVWNSLGWSDEDIVCAFEKFPSLLTVSKEKIRALMDFFVNELGFKPKEIPARTFGRSLDKRIRPRYEVLKILRKWSGQQRKVSLHQIASMPERDFFERYVAPYVDKIPELQKYTSQLQCAQTSR
ncbi:transcription termination factor MTERF8, chloroplastic-like isoform X2 [Aristolochia californica]